MINQNCGTAKTRKIPGKTAFSQQGVFRATQVVLAGLPDLPRSAEFRPGRLPELRAGRAGNFINDVGQSFCEGGSATAAGGF
jgi:hypothetical protein